MFKAEEWEYKNSGNANVIFSYNGSQLKFQNKVLRMRQGSQIIGSKEIFDYMYAEGKFDKLRPWMAEYELYNIDSAFIDNMKSKFNLKLRNDTHVIVMPELIGDVEFIDESISYLKLYKTDKGPILELKPKWLLPNRCVEDDLCRNCLHSSNKGCYKELICPLLLKTPQQWFAKIPKKYDWIKYDLWLEWVETQSIISIIQALQHPLNEQMTDEELCYQMTVRDLSLIIDIESQTCNIIDLDKKYKKSKWLKDIGLGY